MQNPTLQWGLNPAPGEYLAAWGARTYIDDGQLQILHDRQDSVGSMDNRALLCNWFSKDALPALKQAIKTDRRITEFTYTKHHFSLHAKSSGIKGDYIYINATLAGMETPPEGKWSAKFPIPKIGEQVHINFNGLGNGKVIGYFLSEGHVGLIVQLFNQPEWHRRQNGSAAIATVFGAEITTGAGEPPK